MAAPIAQIVVHGGDYPHVRGLTGERGSLRLDYRATAVRQVFVDMIAHRAHEACEFSCANYLLLRATGQDWLTALPIFPYRAFRHSLLVVRRDNPLTGLDQLAGARIGVDDYSMTAAVWVRGMLRADYGIDHRAITWVTPRRQRFSIPQDARVEQVDTDSADGSLEARLLDGRIDAMLGFDLADRKRPAEERRLRTLLPDPHAAERDYFERTRIFPIHHCVVVRNDVLAREPQLPQTLMQAYSTAKRRVLSQAPATLLPWASTDPARDLRLFGGDPLPYGWTEANRRSVAVLAAYLHQQGLIPSLPDVDSLFLPLDEPGAGEESAAPVGPTAT